MCVLCYDSLSNAPGVVFSFTAFAVITALINGYLCCALAVARFRIVCPQITNMSPCALRAPATAAGTAPRAGAAGRCVELIGAGRYPPRTRGVGDCQRALARWRGRPPPRRAAAPAAAPGRVPVARRPREAARVVASVMLAVHRPHKCEMEIIMEIIWIRSRNCGDLACVEYSGNVPVVRPDSWGGLV